MFRLITVKVVSLPWILTAKWTTHCPRLSSHLQVYRCQCLFFWQTGKQKTSALLALLFLIKPALEFSNGSSLTISQTAGAHRPFSHIRSECSGRDRTVQHERINRELWLSIVNDWLIQYESELSKQTKKNFWNRTPRLTLTTVQNWICQRNK